MLYNIINSHPNPLHDGTEENVYEEDEVFDDDDNNDE